MPLRPPRVTEIRGKRVLVRVDFNVPLKTVKTRSGQEVQRVADDQRLRNSLETLNFLQENEVKIILISHLGRPEGKVHPQESLYPVAQYLQRKMGLNCQFAEDCVGEKAKQAITKLQNGEILLLENLRFHPGEESNDPHFAAELAKFADVYINEAFSASHRTHASIVGVSQLLPSFAGFALSFEVKMLRTLLEKTEHPFVVVMGGAKIDDKVATLKNLARLADMVLIGGGLANSFLKAGGIETHRSFIGENPEKTLALARSILQAHKTERSVLPLKEKVGNQTHTTELPFPKIVLPIDVLAAKNKTIDQKKDLQTISLLHDAKDRPDDIDLQYFDLGPQSTQLYCYILRQAKTIFWNGPMGVFENPLFAQGSKKIARCIADRGKHRAITICGGGETGELVNTLGLRDRFSHVSTAGGAALEFLGGSELPGISALEKNT